MNETFDSQPWLQSKEEPQAASPKRECVLHGDPRYKSTGPTKKCTNSEFQSHSYLSTISWLGRQLDPQVIKSHPINIYKRPYFEWCPTRFWEVIWMVGAPSRRGTPPAAWSRPSWPGPPRPRETSALSQWFTSEQGFHYWIITIPNILDSIIP